MAFWYDCLVNVAPIADRKQQVAEEKKTRVISGRVEEWEVAEKADEDRERKSEEEQRGTEREGSRRSSVEQFQRGVRPLSPHSPQKMCTICSRGCAIQFWQRTPVYYLLRENDGDYHKVFPSRMSVQSSARACWEHLDVGRGGRGGGGGRGERPLRGRPLAFWLTLHLPCTTWHVIHMCCSDADSLHHLPAELSFRLSSSQTDDSLIIYRIQIPLRILPARTEPEPALNPHQPWPTQALL